MSRDLRVIGSEVFRFEALAEWLASLGRWEAAAEGALTWVHRVLRRGSEPAFSLDGPLRVEAEDLPPELAGAVLTPQWLVEINVLTGSSETVLKMALRVGRRLADEMDGVLFDPQEDQIVWPKSKQRRMIRLRGAATSDVEFQSAIPARGFSEGLSVELLDLLKLLLPEALPRRYGTFEPLQHRLDEGEAHFHALWQDEAATGLGLFWKATRPVLDGSVSFPGHRPPNDGVAAGSIRIGIDTRVFEEQRWRKAAITLLDGIGDLTSAFSGRALVESRYSGGIPASELDNRPPSMVWRGAWLGLPDQPAWLTWLPPAYVDVIDRSAYANSMWPASHGSVIALSDEPRLAADLLPWTNRFPVEYCRLPESPPPSRDNYVERTGSPMRVANSLPHIGDD